MCNQKLSDLEQDYFNYLSDGNQRFSGIWERCNNIDIQKFMMMSPQDVHTDVPINKSNKRKKGISIKYNNAQAFLADQNSRQFKEKLDKAWWRSLTKAERAAEYHKAARLQPKKGVIVGGIGGGITGGTGLGLLTHKIGKGNKYATVAGAILGGVGGAYGGAKAGKHIGKHAARRTIERYKSYNLPSRLQ